MAPKKAKAKASTSAASARRSRRLVGANAEVAQSGASTPADPSEDDPEDILRRARSEQRRKRGGRRARASGRKSVGGRKATTARHSVARASHHETGQLHLPPAAQVGRASASEEVSGANTPAPAPTPLREEASTADTTSAARAPPASRFLEGSDDAFGTTSTVHTPSVGATPTTSAEGRAASDAAQSQAQATNSIETPSDRQTDNSASENGTFDVNYMSNECANNTSQEAETGAEHNDNTVEEPPSSDARDLNFNKRPSEDSAEGDSEPKRPKTSNEDGQDGGVQGSAPNPPPPEPCQDYRNALGGLRDGLGEATASIEYPAVMGQYLYHETTLQAVAAVTEAIAGNGGPQCSLIDSITARSRGGQNIARPGNTLYYPSTTGGQSSDARRTGGGHLSLFVFDLTEPGAFGEDAPSRSINAHHWNSSSDPNEYTVNRAYGEARGVLERNNWINNDLMDGTVGDFPDSPDDRHALRQRREWVCGLHVIFNAWTHALGLAPGDAHDFGPAFYQHGVEIINLALFGRMDSNTIRSFLACHHFVDRNSEVPPDRTFDLTHPFRNAHELSLHVARIRLERELELDPRRDSGTPELEIALEVIRDVNPDFQEGAIINWGSADVIQHYNQARAIADTDPQWRPTPQLESGEETSETSLPGDETLERTRTSSLQESLRRQILAGYDLSGVSPETYRLLMEVPLERLDDIYAILETLPRVNSGSREPPSTEVSPTTTIPPQPTHIYAQGNAPSRYSPLPGLGYDLNDVRGSENEYDQPINAGERSPNLRSLPPPGPSSTPGGNDDEEDHLLEHGYRPPFISPHESAPYDPETPGIDEADLTDYRATDSDLEDGAEDAAEDAAENVPENVVENAPQAANQDNWRELFGEDE